MRIAAVLRLVTPALALLFTLAGPAYPTLDAQAAGRERTLFVSAVDKSGNPVEDLGPSDFVVREDGARREVLRSSRAVEPIDIAVLVDNSAASHEIIPRLREGLKAFVASMTPQNAIAIIGLADRPTIIVDYTSEQKRLTDGIGRLFTQSTSAMTFLDAVTEVSKGMERRETPRAVIVPIITDGTDYSSRYYREGLEAMQRAGVGMHAITVGTFPVSNDEAIRSRSLILAQGTRLTGGQWMELLTAMAVEPSLQKLARQLSSQYKVVYGRPESLIPPEKIEVSSGRAGITTRGTPARGQKTGA